MMVYVSESGWHWFKQSLKEDRIDEVTIHTTMQTPNDVALEIKEVLMK